MLQRDKDDVARGVTVRIVSARGMWCLLRFFFLDREGRWWL